jgi:ABC-2 type transport system permease protein
MQMVKSKPFIISTVVIFSMMLLMVVGMNFLPGLLSGSFDFGDDGGIILVPGEGNEPGMVSFGVDKIYISDQSGLNLTFSFLYEYGMDVNMISVSEIDAITAQIFASHEAEVLLEITRDEGFYSVLISRPESTELIDTGICNFVLSVINSHVRSSHLLSIGVPADILDEADVGVWSQVTIAGETPKNEIALILSGIVPMISALVLFMFIFVYAQFAAQSIATEKTSRVMETLLTSVRPMAVILGKVLGMGLASISQFFLMIATGFGFAALFSPMGAIGEITGSVEISDPEMQLIKNAFDEAFSSFNAMSIVWILIIFVLGFLFYSLIAGLVGASINRMEDLQTALQPMALVGVLGFMLAYMAPAVSVGTGEVNIVQRISYYLPISSPFALPSAIVSGEMTTVDALIAVGILAVLCVLMLMFVSKVYEAIILHTGNRIKLGTMFKLAKKK